MMLRPPGEEDAEEASAAPCQRPGAEGPSSLGFGQGRR